MSPFKTVAIAGATGNLGPWLVKALVGAGFDVTIISRVGSQRTAGQGVKRVVEVDYNSQESLINGLKGHDVLVSNLPNHDGQKSLIDAAIAAGVKRFLPSEFGSNISGNQKTAALPMFKDGKTAIQKYLAEKGDAITWTVVVNGIFLEFAVGVGMALNPKGTTSLYDGGNTKFCTTQYLDVGKAVIGVLRNPEQTKNRTVYVHSAVTTQNELLAAARRVNPSFNGPTENVSIAKVEEDAYHKLQSGKDVESAMLDFIVVSVFDPACESNWSDRSDNKLLGIQEMSQAELDSFVAKYVGN